MVFVTSADASCWTKWAAPGTVTRRVMSIFDVQEPTIGAGVNYGLGSLNDNLPQFINMGPRFFDKRDGRYLGPAYDAVPLVITCCTASK